MDRKFRAWQLAVTNNLDKIMQFIDHPEYKELPEYAEAAAVNRVGNRAVSSESQFYCPHCGVEVHRLDWECPECGEYI